MPTHYDTIVVGLGSAGVTAASYLARAGKRVLGLEAQDRIGGRVCTVPFGEGVVELGAEWIHGTEHNRVYDLAIQNNVSILPQDLDLKLYSSDGTQPDQALAIELIKFCLKVSDVRPKTPQPVGQYVTNELMDYLREKHPTVLNDKEYVDQILEVMNLLLNNNEASNDWNDVSAWTQYEVLDGHLHMSWNKNGYKTFFEILLNTYNNGTGLSSLETKLNTEVTLITWPQDPKENVKVTTKDGTVYTAYDVIVTVSLGVLKEKYSTLFSPALPQEKKTAIEKISMGTKGKVILSFPHVWWPFKDNMNILIWKGEHRQKVPSEDAWTTKIMGFSGPKGSDNVITIWIMGDGAKVVETLPEDVVKRKCMSLLRQFMGANITIPEPTGVLRSTWFSNPFIRGSYTYDNVQVAEYLTTRKDLAQPLTDSTGKLRVLFAGEGTSENHFSTVHGAAETGYREAMRLLSSSSKL